MTFPMASGNDLGPVGNTTRVFRLSASTQDNEAPPRFVTNNGFAVQRRFTANAAMNSEPHSPLSPLLLWSITFRRLRAVWAANTGPVHCSKAPWSNEVPSASEISMTLPARSSMLDLPF
jgi:hypothetical protein